LANDSVHNTRPEAPFARICGDRTLEDTDELDFLTNVMGCLHFLRCIGLEPFVHFNQIFDITGFVWTLQAKPPWAAPREEQGSG